MWLNTLSSIFEVGFSVVALVQIARLSEEAVHLMTSDELHGEGFYNPDNVEEDRKYPSLAGFMAVNYALLLAMLALPTVPLIWILR